RTIDALTNMLAAAEAAPLSTLVLSAIGLSALALVFAVIGAFRRGGGSDATLRQALDALVAGQERFERSVADAMQRSRQEQAEGARHLREEVNASIRVLAEGLARQSAEQARQQGEASKALGETVKTSLETFGERAHQQSRQLFDIQKQQHDSFEARVQALSEAQRLGSEA